MPLEGIAHENGKYYPYNMQTISLKVPEGLLEQIEGRYFSMCGL